MSSSPNPYLGSILGSTDPKQMAVVQTILQKTREKKIYWSKAKMGFIAVVQTSGTVPIRIEFLCPSAPPTTTWNTFCVTTSEGIILRVENSAMNAVFARLGGIGPDPLPQIISELFALVNEVGEGGLERAKNLLDRL